MHAFVLWLQFAIVPCCTCSKDFPNRMMTVEHTTATTTATSTSITTSATTTATTIITTTATTAATATSTTTTTATATTTTTSASSTTSLPDATPTLTNTCTAPKTKLVKSYNDLVTYLMRKDPRIRRATLDIGGKNTVLYLLPSK